MYGDSHKPRAVRAAVVVAIATLFALAVPGGSPLYAQIYPGPDAGSINEALGTAGLDLGGGFTSTDITQFETTSYSATIVYGTAAPGLPTVKIAWSNEARLAEQDQDTFEITPTSDSRRFLDSGTRRSDGGYELTWTWDVTPLVAGKQTLVLSILPTVVVEGQTIPDLANINKPIPVEVDVHPIKRDFDDVLTAAESMDLDVPDEMTVGEEHDVGASMSLAGHSDTVGADIELSKGEGSAAVTITKATAAARPTAHVASAASAASADDTIVRQWTVIPDEPGQVSLVFTATVEGQAEAHGLQQEVLKEESARATQPGPSFWELLQQPVLYIAPFVALAIGVLGLLAAWKKRKAQESVAGDQDGDSSQGDPAS